MFDHLPVILIELVLVFGGVLAFAWWQLRSVRRDRLEAAARRQRERPAESEPESEPEPEGESRSGSESDTATPGDDLRRP